jgi:hypothetical protein
VLVPATSSFRSFLHFEFWIDLLVARYVAGPRNPPSSRRDGYLRLPALLRRRLRQVAIIGKEFEALQP